MSRPRPRILGIDFTSAPRPAKPITIALGTIERDALTLDDIVSVTTFAGFEQMIAAPGPWIGGFDFPFGLPREAVEALGWPTEWPALIRHCAALGRAGFRVALDAYRESRAIGNRYAHRATDAPARSHSPLKLVNPPVGLMFLEGAPRLLAADVSIPGIRAGDQERIALEAYPGFIARRITTASYKSDERAKQTPERRSNRATIVAALERGEGSLGFSLTGQRALLRSLVDDASGDRLDAVLAALAAAWAWRRRARNYGLPANVDGLEGWIAGVTSAL